MLITGPRQGAAIIEHETPSYWVEHLATFAVGREFGLLNPSDGIRKLKQLEKNSAIWAQPMVLRLRPNLISVEDENGVTLFFFIVKNFIHCKSSHISG